MNASSETVTISSLASSRKRLAGTYAPPPDKSITHRAVFFSALSARESRIRNPLASGDCLSTASCFSRLGVPIEQGKSEWIVRAGTRDPRHGYRHLKPADSCDLDCGNSGTTMRLISGVLSAQDFSSRLTGDASLSKRPMSRVIEPLSKMGARIRAREGKYAPLEIDGNPELEGIEYRTPMASAQVKSAVLLAGLFAKGRTTVEEPTRSRDHSERMLKGLGAHIQFDLTRPADQPHRVSIEGGAELSGLDLIVPGDFSSAAFFIAAALIVPGSDLLIRDVNLNPTRTGFLKVVKRMGGEVKVVRSEERCGEPIGDLQVVFSSLKGTSLSPQEIPLLVDEVPVLAVLATQAEGETVIRGAQELRVKETDRLAAVASELRKMGASVEERQDGLVVRGRTKLQGAAVKSYDDHRMAMSLSVAALVAQGDTRIEAFNCIRISYPGFREDLEKAVRS